MQVVERREQRAREQRRDHDPGRVAARMPGRHQPPRVGERDEPGERAVEQQRVAQPAGEPAALLHHADPARGGIEGEMERQHEQHARGEHQQQPAHGGGPRRLAAGVAQPGDQREREQPRHHRIGPGVDRVEEADRKRAHAALEQRARARREPRAVEHDLQREGECEQRERQRQHVRVQVGQQERERRVLVDRVVDHARRREPVVLAQRPAVGDQQPRALEIAGDEHERDREQARAHGSPRPPRDAPDRRRGREQRRGGQREERRHGEVVALVGRHRREPHEQPERELAEVVVVELGAGEPGILRRERGGPVRRVEERHVHRLLGVPDVGRVGDEQRHAREGDEEDRLRAPEQPLAQRVRLRRHACGQPAPAPAREPAARLGPCERAPSAPSAHPNQQPERAHERDPQRGAQSAVGHERRRTAEPYQPRREQQPEHLAEAEPGAGQACQQQPGQRRSAETDQLDERPEAQRLGHGPTSWLVGGTVLSAA